MIKLELNDQDCHFIQLCLTVAAERFREHQKMFCDGVEALSADNCQRLSKQFALQASQAEALRFKLADAEELDS